VFPHRVIVARRLEALSAFLFENTVIGFLKGKFSFSKKKGLRKNSTQEFF
jgi:hypothetical protein